MLKISKLADYAILLMTTIVSSNKILSAKDIAAQIHLAEPTVSKLLKILTKQGFLISERGVNGGYRSANPATEINIAEIIEAIDGKIAIIECSKNQGDCTVASSCKVSRNWQKISTAIRNCLIEISLSDLQTDLPKNPIHFDLRKRIKT